MELCPFGPAFLSVMLNLIPAKSVTVFDACQSTWKLGVMVIWGGASGVPMALKPSPPSKTTGLAKSAGDLISSAALVVHLYGFEILKLAGNRASESWYCPLSFRPMFLMPNCCVKLALILETWVPVKPAWP